MPFDRHVQLTYITGSKLISSKPCWLYGVIGEASSSSESNVIVYDGQDTNASHSNKFDTYGNREFGLSDGVPVFFAHGLYVYLESNVSFLNVKWRPALPKNR